jgi:hypothetical protein
MIPTTVPVPASQLVGLLDKHQRSCILRSSFPSTGPYLAAMLSPRRSYLGTEICGLCRLKLPWDDSAGRDPWESTFRAGMIQPSML